MQEITLTLRNRVGFHARPAPLFVQRANEFKCHIRVVSHAGAVEVNGKSILGVVGLYAGHGAVITMRSEVEDAKEAIASILALFDDNPGEVELTCSTQGEKTEVFATGPERWSTSWTGIAAFGPICPVESFDACPRGPLDPGCAVRDVRGAQGSGVTPR